LRVDHTRDDQSDESDQRVFHYEVSSGRRMPEPF
jgi:hypothetical protein